MKARLTKSCQGRHPEFSREPGYDGPQFINRDVGDIIEGPDAWMLCMPDINKAVPADDECAGKVLAQMSSPARKAFIAQLRENLQPNMLQQLSKEAQEALQQLAETYADELTEPENTEEFESFESDEDESI